MNQEFASESPVLCRLAISREQLITRIRLFAVFLFLVYMASILSSTALIQFGNAQFTSGNFRIGAASYTLAFEFNSKLKKAANQCSADIAQQQYKLAIEHCSTAVDINKYHAAAYYNRGLAYHNLERNEQAIADFTKAIELISIYRSAYISRGFAYIPQGQSNLAVADCNKAVDLDGRDATAYYCLGLAFYAQENYDLATTNFDNGSALSVGYAL